MGYKMISIILLGRNDSYGYNLHKRAAISINCIAELLTDKEDEIVYVEYNAIDSLPTFPEAIQDTLTAKAQKRLRIIRVPAAVHDNIKFSSHLNIIEPVARNIALRRSNEKNRWILSTNTDMIFVPRDNHRSLSEIVEQQERGFYCCPRFELPEKLWESLDRKDPRSIIQKVSSWGKRFRLNEAVLIHPFMLYDGPGDFQLVQRKDLFSIHGFNEEMIIGWHVDANLCKRMSLLFGAPRSLADDLFSYHCDHTRVETPMHAGTRVENDWDVYCLDVTSPTIPAQAETWGLPDERFPEIVLASAAGYERLLGELVPPLEGSMTQVDYTKASYNTNLYYDIEHTIVFLADMLAHVERKSKIAYFGSNTKLIGLLTTFLAKSGFVEPVIVSADCLTENVLSDFTRFHDNNEVFLTNDVLELNKADFFIVDTSCHNLESTINTEGFVVPKLNGKFLWFWFNLYFTIVSMCVFEKERSLLGLPQRKFIILGSLNTFFDIFTLKMLKVVAVPYCCHLRYGYPVLDKDFELIIKQFSIIRDIFSQDISRLDMLIEMQLKILGLCEHTIVDYYDIKKRWEAFLGDIDQQTTIHDKKFQTFLVTNVFVAMLFGVAEDVIMGNAMELLMAPDARGDA